MMMSETVKRHRVSALWRVELPKDLHASWGIAVGALLGTLMWIVILTGIFALVE